MLPDGRHGRTGGLMIGGSRRWHALRGCAALLLSLAIAGASAAEGPGERPMTFTLEAETPAIIAAHQLLDHGDRSVYASGDIVEGTTESLLAFVRQNHLEHARLFFDSGGGDVGESLKLGEEIRKHRFNTAVGRAGDAPDEESEAVCASACVFAYAGGESRFMPANSGRLGIHQFYAAKRKAAIAETQAWSGMIVAYLGQMGVDPQAFSLQTMVDPGSILWLTPKQARELNFVNDGARPTTAEIKLIDMIPVLMLSQQRFNLEMNAALTCSNSGVRINAWLHDDYSNAAHMRGLTRAYFELDGQLALDGRGANSASFDGTGVSVSRRLPDETLVRLLAANSMALWFENGGSLRWGGAMDLHDVHDKMADYFLHCTQARSNSAALAADAPSPPPPAAAPARRPAPAPARTPAPAASHRPDLVIATRTFDPDRHDLILVDRATSRRRGALVTITGYLAILDKTEWTYFENDYTFDCNAHRIEAAGHVVDRRGRQLGLFSSAWEPTGPGSAGRMMENIACERGEVSESQLLDTTDPYAALAYFVEIVSHQGQPSKGDPK
jgi:hypothetical protein